MNIDDLLTQDLHEEGAEVCIKDPRTGEDTDVYILVLGVDSLEWQKSQKRAINQFISKSSGKEKVTEEDEIAADIDQLVSATIGWRGLVKGGKELKFSADECRQLYTKAPHVRQQVNRFVGDRENFTKG